MAVKHLITWGIGFSSTGDYPKFQVTRGLDIGVGVSIPAHRLIFLSRVRASRPRLLHVQRVRPDADNCAP